MILLLLLIIIIVNHRKCYKRGKNTFTGFKLALWETVKQQHPNSNYQTFFPIQFRLHFFIRTLSAALQDEKRLQLVTRTALYL